MPLYLYNSNRLEILAEAFNTLVARDPLPPLLPELVVLQSGGMARWLSMQVAQKSGICANLDCPFPNQFVERIFSKVLGDDCPPTFDREILQWKLMEILPSLLEDSEFSLLKGYLDGAEDLKAFRFAGRIADLFDQYTVFRPEMVMDWERGEGEGWQPILWRYLREREDCLKHFTHRAGLRDQFREALKQSDCPEVFDQRRFSIFGISSIPVFHLDVMIGLSEQLDVHFFFMNPCREYWDDIVPGKVIDKFAVGQRIDQGELYYQEGNPLLASSGRQGRELLSILHGSGDWVESDLFYDPVERGNPSSALGIIQSDILNLRSAQPEEFKISKTDRSIEYHSCHSPLRELEVLHNQLLQMFERDPELEPKDILVMVPDIDSYSPFVYSVFSTRGEEHNIPFSIADRRLRSDGVLCRAFQDVLDLKKSRMEMSKIMAILEFEAVRIKFGFNDEDVGRIEKWLSEVRVLWGIEAEHKIEIGLPGFDDNTWRQGFDRLLLGYAMAGESNRTFGGILPADTVEGTETEVLGRFIDFVELLINFRQKMEGKRDLGGWSDLLVTILKGLFASDGDHAREFSQLVEFSSGLKERQEEAGYPHEVEYEVIRSCLDNYLDQGGLSRGFMTGRATFCELLPMRAVPFKCICLLGMNEGDFPRIASAPGFDLIASDPKPGDRSRKTDDRYLFLETILSARDRLYISYVGQSNKDGSTLLPSVLVSELLDYFAHTFDGSEGEIYDPIIRHPMHGFSERYFSGDTELVSFSEVDFKASGALLKNETPEQMVADDLPELSDDFRTIDLRDLVTFFRNPAKYLCRHRLGIHLATSESHLQETEAFTVDGLDRYKVGTWFLEKTLSGEIPSNVQEILRLQGIMPHGNPGLVEIGKIEEDVNAFAGKVSSFCSGGIVKLAEGIVQVGDFTVRGSIEGCQETDHQVLYRFGKIKAADQVSGWVRHLFFNSLNSAREGTQTIVIGNDKSLIFDAVPESDTMLADLLEIYWYGMRKVLPFFPETSLVYAEELEKKGEGPALVRSRSKWLGDEYSRGESEDPYYKLSLREIDPFDDQFIHLATRFFAPLLERRDKL